MFVLKESFFDNVVLTSNHALSLNFPFRNLMKYYYYYSFYSISPTIVHYHILVSVFTTAFSALSLCVKSFHLYTDNFHCILKGL